MGIKWREELETGIERIDNQHKELFNRINDLLEACRKGEGREEVENTMEFLKGYIITHFGDEEKRMKEEGFEQFSSHKRAHERFIEEFEMLEDQFEEKGATVDFVIKINKTITEWFIDHIGKRDKNFASYIKEN